MMSIVSGLITFLEQFESEHALQSRIKRLQANHGQPGVVGCGDESGRSSAYNRLRLVLMHDRTQLEAPKLEAMRDELVGVISRYIEIDQKAMELNLETDQETNTVALVANIPVMPARVVEPAGAC